MKQLMLSLLIVLGLGGAGLMAQEQAQPSLQPLSDEQIDQVFDEVFAKQQQITRMQCKVITRKVGGIFNKEVETWGYAYAQMPDLLLFVDRGEVTANLSESKAATILIDGTFLWDIKPADEEGGFEAERLSVNTAGDRDLNIAALLIGADVATGKQLREYYELTGWLVDLGAQGKSYKFMLKTSPGKEKNNRKEEVEVWIRPGEVIPWQINSVRLTPQATNPFGKGEAASGYRRTASTKIISDLQTNLSNPPLPAFAPEVFYFGQFLKKFPKTRVIDGRGQELTPQELEASLQNVLSKLRDHK